MILKKKILCLLLNLLVFVGVFCLLDFLNALRLDHLHFWTWFVILNLVFDILILGAFKTISTHMILLTLIEFTLLIIITFLYVAHNASGMLG